MKPDIISRIVGILPRVTRLQRQVSSKAEANALQVKVGVQADCLSASGSTASEEAPEFPRSRRHRRG
jgi:predicted metalloprotease